MTNVFVNDLKAMCGALLHALWKIERSDDPSVIPLDLARDILSYLGTFREHEVIMKELVVAEELKERDGNKANDDPSNTSTEPTESESVKDDNAVDQSVNEEQKIVVDDDLKSVDEVNASDFKMTENELDAEEQPSSANDDTVIEEKPIIINEQIAPITVNDTSRTVALLTHVIGQLEGDLNEKNHTINEEYVRQNEPPEAAIQADIFGTTTQAKNEAVQLKRSKRKPKPTEEMEKFLKRRRSVDFRLLNNHTISKSVVSRAIDIARGAMNEKDLKTPVTIVDIQPEKQTTQMMMKKRQSKLRQTICVQRPDIEVDEEELFSIRKNTDIQMYATNGDYHKKWCEVCKKTQTHLVPHFVREHPEYEVPISRPSPTMAKQLRQQAQAFTQLKGGKLSGLCWFCEESKSLPKYRWVNHFLVHTGENMFVCNTCDKTYKTRSDHKTCGEEPVNIHYTNLERSVMGFICKDCNFTQLFRGNILKHLTNEHGYVGPDENCHYKRVQLVPDLERVKPDSKK